MLELKGITKQYQAGDQVVDALKGIDLCFRENEFVSILGPSGCGKTTLLNLIGGLDRYTDGDLIINGKSTKDFRDADWDAYRNHSIGFVFQTYNLIPHQSVLANVELALTLSGVSAEERKRRATEALARVGLADQVKKRPNQLSGGQMQRVAIARALVNNPDIILADEPTGALDSETSVQVMEILKEVAKDRLVIMVTHNPELAEKYSTRIVRMLDGLVTSDDAPLGKDEYAKEQAADEAKQKADRAKKKKRKEKRPSMSFFTAFGLSLKNLFTKKGRTMLTSFAGSIGIIGIALIYAVSQGMTSYIDFVQEETLSSYPLVLESEHTDLASLMQSFMEAAVGDSEHSGEDAVYEKTALYDLVNALNNREVKQNDLSAFKTHIDAEKLKEDSLLGKALSGVHYSYDLNLLTYTKSVDGTIILSDTQALIADLLAKNFGAMLSSMGAMSVASSMPTPMMTLWQEMLPGLDGACVNPLIEKQYEMLTEDGRWPNAYNEIVLVVDENNEIDDMTLYALGLKSREEMEGIINSVFNGKQPEKAENSWSFEELVGMEFKVIPNAARFQKNEQTGLYEDRSTTQAGLDILYRNEGINLKITGIVRPNEDSISHVLSGTIAYTYKLTEKVVEKSKEANALIAQLDNPNSDIFTGLPFKEASANYTDAQKAALFTEFLEYTDDAEKAELFIRISCIPSEQILSMAIQQANMQYPTREAREGVLAAGLASSTGMSESDIRGYLTEMTDEEIEELFLASVVDLATKNYATATRKQIESTTTEEQRVAALLAAAPNYTEEQRARFYDEAMEFSESSYNANLRRLGYVDLDVPSAINLYAATFESKDIIEEAIAEYNKGVEEEQRIAYTDYVGIMMSSITTIIDVITYVLIAFVAISLVVSSIMIGVITLISVQERTKEIGILRAIGASKKNVSSVFNAETVIIGFTSGALGVLITYLLCIPINLILHALTGIMNLNAVLPLPVALILIGISMILTLFAGIIPSRSAAKKDPVVALRTE